MEIVRATNFQLGHGTKYIRKGEDFFYQYLSNLADGRPQGPSAHHATTWLGGVALQPWLLQGIVGVTSIRLRGDQLCGEAKSFLPQPQQPKTSVSFRLPMCFLNRENDPNEINSSQASTQIQEIENALSIWKCLCFVPDFWGHKISVAVLAIHRASHLWRAGLPILLPRSQLDKDHSCTSRATAVCGQLGWCRTTYLGLKDSDTSFHLRVLGQHVWVAWEFEAIIWWQKERGQTTLPLSSFIFLLGIGETLE